MCPAPGGEWGRSAHTCRARRGRPAPAVEFQPDSPWVYRSATEARVQNQRGRHGIDAKKSLSADQRR
jgi:hypothetical protein